MAEEKPHMNLVFIGHVDHGKSTTVGRLLYDSGNVDDQTMRKLKEKAQELGKAGFEFAFVMDNLKEEQARGVTIDLAHREFKTKKFFFTIIDAPGHRDFIKNMITGASQADAAVLVVSAADGVQTQTIEHAKLSKILGVGQLIVVVNKMDFKGVDYAESKFNQTVDGVKKTLQVAGWKIDQVKFVPTASYPGSNVVKNDGKMPWYKGPTLMESLDFLSVPEKPTKLPLRMPIQDVYNIKGIGVVPVGKIETGILKAGDKVMIVPGREGKGISGEVKTIEMHHQSIPQALPGDNVGLSIRGVAQKDIARGDVLGRADSPPIVVSEFTGQIVVMDHPSVITIGYTPVFHVHTAQVACRVSEIVKTIDPATGQTKQEKPDFIKNGDIAVVKFVPVQPLVIERVQDNPKLARFAIRDSGKTVGAGVCQDIVKKA